jgi:hypothetical protein
LTKIIESVLGIIAVLTVLIVIISLQQSAVFAMHDSTLGVDTWIASDNSTQLHTIDLNKGPVDPTSATTEGVESEDGGVTDEEEESDTGEGEEEEEEEQSTGENGEDGEEDE